MATHGASPARAQRRRAAGNVQDNRDVRSGIWIVHPMGVGARIPLLGDLRHEHFYFAEGDPSVCNVDYMPEPTITTLDNPGERPVRFDAVVTRLDGSRLCRRVAERRLDSQVESESRLIERSKVAARRYGGTFEEVVPAQLDASSVRIANWVRVIGAHLRCRGRPLGVTEAIVMAAVSGDGHLTLGNLLDRMSDHAAPLVLASVAERLRLRHLASDLDEHPWSRHTRLWRAAL